MPFTKKEAVVWAEAICDTECELEGRYIDHREFCSVMDAILMSIGQDADDMGWYDEWAIIESKARAAARENAAKIRESAEKRLPLGEQLHAEAVGIWIEAQRRLKHEIPDGAPRTIDDLASYILQRSILAAKNAQFSITIKGWPVNVDGKDECYADLTHEQIDQLVKKLDDTGFQFSVIPHGGTHPDLARNHLRVSW